MTTNNTPAARTGYRWLLRFVGVNQYGESIYGPYLNEAALPGEGAGL